MKFVVSTTELVSVISKIQNVVSSKPPIPLLANLLLEARDDQLIISVTDLTISMKATMYARVQSSGAVTLPARRLFHLLRELTLPQTHFEVIDSIARIQSGASHFSLNGMQATKFPTITEELQAPSICFDALELKEMLARVAFAAAREDPKNALNGVYIPLSSHAMAIVGTDGKRLAKLSVPTPLHDLETSYLVPLKAVEEITKILDSEQMAKVYFLEKKLGIEVDNFYLVTKLLAGEYPDFERIIPKGYTTSIKLHKEELETLLKQIALFTKDRASSAAFKFTHGELQLKAATHSVGEGQVSMPVDYHNEDFEIAFNPHFFLDILRHCKGEVVTLSLTNSYNPGLIADNSHATFVLMPMRLQIENDELACV